MKYDDTIFYRSRDKFIRKITKYIEQELDIRYKDLENTTKFSKRYFITSGAIGSLTRLEDKLSLEKHKIDWNG